jgi:LysR family transcriptional regulator, regulator for bpeEF and oprC
MLPDQTTMELAALTALVKVVQTGSFTRAAEQLGTQKAHLSRVISRLEAELGVRLLERSTRSLSLTEVGREFHERAIGILGEIEAAERMTQQVHGEPRGVLRITCGVEFGMIAVNRWISSYLDRFPEASVEAEFTGRLVDIVHEGFDLAVRVGSLSDSSLTARKLGELRYGLFAAQDYLQRRGRPVAPVELAGHDLLMFNAGSHRQGWRLLRGDEEFRIEQQARLKVNNSFAVRDAACQSLGIARLPLVLAAPLVESGRLAAVLEDWVMPNVPVNALFASARYLTPKVRSFIDHAIESGIENGAAALSV